MINYSYSVFIHVTDFKHEFECYNNFAGMVVVF